jgi:hypothetical protein
VNDDLRAQAIADGVKMSQTMKILRLNGACARASGVCARVHEGAGCRGGGAQANVSAAARVGNHFGPKGAKAIAEAVKACSTIEVLELFCAGGLPPCTPRRVLPRA